MILRAANAADIPALSRLATDAFVAKFGHLYAREDLDTFLRDCLSEAAVAQDFADPLQVYRLAEAEGRLLGFCKISAKCGFPDHARGEKAMELKQLYTAPDATGMGIGAALMDWAMAEARAYEADAIQLSVWSGNTDAQRFYTRYGFAKVADIEFWVGEQCDEEFLFALKL